MARRRERSLRRVVARDVFDERRWDVCDVVGRCGRGVRRARLVFLERRGGLDLACAKALNDEEEANGVVVERKGDKDSNSGEYNRRHHGVMNATAAMVRAVAVGQVALGDKANKAATDLVNETCVVDVVELQGDESTGADVSYEIKCAAPLVQTAPKGRGTRKTGGKPASVGHLYRFGSTEEKLRLKILGCRRRGRKQDGPLDHSTGKGWVERAKGDYYDAIHVKKHPTTLVATESSGAVSPDGVAYLRRLTRVVRTPDVSDTTIYGVSRASTQSFFRHHLAAWSAAIVITDARTVIKAADTYMSDIGHRHAPAPSAPPARCATPPSSRACVCM